MRTRAIFRLFIDDLPPMAVTSTHWMSGTRHRDVEHGWARNATLTSGALLSPSVCESSRHRLWPALALRATGRGKVALTLPGQVCRAELYRRLVKESNSSHPKWRREMVYLELIRATVTTNTDSGFLKYCASVLVTVLGRFIETAQEKLS